VLQLLIAQDLLQPLEQILAGLVQQLADVLLVCLDGCHGLVFLLAREFQIVNDPLDASRTRNTRARNTRARSTRTRTYYLELAADTEPSGSGRQSGRQLLDLVLVEGAVLVGVASGD